MRATAAGATAALMMLALGGCGAGTGAAALVQVVELGNSEGRFEPAALTVPIGTEVRWRNEGNESHTVTADHRTVADAPALPPGTEPWDSGVLYPGDTFSHRFDRSGSYLYWCSRHRHMVGVIEVIP